MSYRPGNPLNLPPKFPFWSAIITQTQGSVSVANGASVIVNIQPASGETWLVDITASLVLASNSNAFYIIYQDYNGTTARIHTHSYVNDYVYIPQGTNGLTHYPNLSLTRILTNSLYAQLYYYNASGSSTTGYYGYSGFKLSQPQWTTKKVSSNADLPFKRPASSPLPSLISPLSKYAVDILDPIKNSYKTVVVLEQDTPLATDPKTGFPVERYSAYVEINDLANLITGFKNGTLDPVITGYRKYLDKWKQEGIDFGV